MSVTEERTPFTLPLTGQERRELIGKIDEVLRRNGRHMKKHNGTSNLDFDKEVEEALAAFRKMQSWTIERLNQEVAA